jgi:hypothetical protein
MLGTAGASVELPDSEKELGVDQEGIPGPDDDVPF